jgi:tetratricopeptide (TPR) repeat protein
MSVAADAKLQACLRLHRGGRLAEAYRKILATRPNHGECLRQLGMIALQRGEPRKALEWLDAALRAEPVSAVALSHRGDALAALGNQIEALEDYARAIALDRSLCEAHNGLGNALARLGRFEEALASYERAIELAPGDSPAVYNRDICRLLLGQEKEGSRDHESRWAVKHIVAPVRQISAPNWRGEELSGRRILLFCEQGLGDAIQFVRFAPLLQRRGCEVTILAPSKLLRLFRHSMPDLRFVRAPILTINLIFGAR